MDTREPDKETLRRTLDNEWQDHFQTRRQTWKTLEIATLFFGVFVIVDLRFQDTWLLVSLGLLVLFAIVSGLRASIHHRHAQIRKFTHIDRLEEALGLHKTGLLDDVRPPRPFLWTDPFNPRQANTPLFITRLYLGLLVFFVLYMVARLAR